MAVKNFIPKIWSARLVEHLDKAHVYGMLVNRDYEGEISKYGDTVQINQIGDVTIGDYEGSVGTPQELDGESQTLTIDQQKFFNFAIDDVDNAQTNPKLMNEAMARASYGMADVTDQYIANLMSVNAGSTLGTDETPIVPTKEDAYDYLVDLATLLTENNVPMHDRWVVVPAWFHGLLLKDSRFVAGGTDVNTAILFGGEVGSGAGFRIYVSNNVPNTSGAKYKIVAGTNRATSFAEQLIEVKAYEPEDSFADAVKGLNVYGCKVTQPKGLAVMTVNRK